VPFGRITYPRRFSKTGAHVASSVAPVGHGRNFCQVSTSSISGAPSPKWALNRSLSFGSKTTRPCSGCATASGIYPNRRSDASGAPHLPPAISNIPSQKVLRPRSGRGTGPLAVSTLRNYRSTLSLPQTCRFCKRTATSGLPFGGLVWEVLRLLAEAKINLKVDSAPWRMR
jgi:hypothetical protein